MIIATLGGNLGGDAEQKSVGSTNVTNFSIASTDYNSKTQENETIWVNCALWGARGDSLVQYLTKGSKVMVSGKLSQDTYTAKSTGEPKTSLKITVDQIQLMGSKGKDEDVPDPFA
jgi:single-strand DNA-binding protein|tara:strand:- start:546 stop:893 length:348 start_codon:yes stop_codon:yes gene_type:complete